MKALPLVSLLGLLAAAAAAEIEVRNTLRNTDGEALAGLLVHARPLEGNDAEGQTTRTDAEGAFWFTLPDGAWWVEIDPAELLELGYFCVPGWNPDPGWPTIELEAVPLTPRFGYEFAGEKITLVATFDWLAGLQPLQLRRCRIERSEDLVEWEAIETILLQNPPIRIEDPYPQGKACFYRAVDAGVVLVSAPPLE